MNPKTVVQILMKEISNAFPNEIPELAKFPNKIHRLLELRVTFSCKLSLKLDPLLKYEMQGFYTFNLSDLHKG